MVIAGSPAEIAALDEFRAELERIMAGVPAVIPGPLDDDQPAAAAETVPDTANRKFAPKTRRRRRPVAPLRFPTSPPSGSCRPAKGHENGYGNTAPAI